MYNIYKVTAAHIKKTKKGYELYNLQLNKSLWATKLVPLSENDKAHDSLYKQYVNNQKNLQFLVGRYIAIELEDSKFGTNFTWIESLDVLQDFKDLLDKSSGKAFFTRINVFQLLSKKSYPINADGSITLQGPYSTFNIKIEGEFVICYPNKTENGTLTLGNIKRIYDKFYKDKLIDDDNPNRSEQYALTPVSIIVNRTIYHKTKSQIVRLDSFNVLSIGEKLSEDKLKFISDAH